MINNKFSARSSIENTFGKRSISVKAGVHLKAVFPPLNLGLMRISRSHLKQSKTPMLKKKSMFYSDL